MGYACPMADSAETTGPPGQQDSGQQDSGQRQSGQGAGGRRPESPLQHRLRRLIDAHGWTWRETSERAGLKETAVKAIMYGRSRNPRADTLTALARAFGCAVEDLTGVRTGPAPPGGPGQHGSLPVANARLDRLRLHGLTGDRDLPIYGSAQGGTDGAMVIGPDPVEVVRRPQPLLSVPRGFGVYVTGDSMEPAFRHGDMVLVHPSRPPRRGDDVLLVHHDVIQLVADVAGSDALVKRLVTWSDDSWVVEQFNPPDRFELPKAYWQQSLLIVGCYRGG